MRPSHSFFLKEIQHIIEIKHKKVRKHHEKRVQSHAPQIQGRRRDN